MKISGLLLPKKVNFLPYLYPFQKSAILLHSLTIKNFTLIEEITLSLGDKLTIITGETGAGKSILIGALSLLLGERANLNSLKDPGKKCVIEGVFAIEKYGLQPLFEDCDLDYNPQTIIRREILPSGRSRAFVNDTPVKLKQLSALGSRLVDIHSQHETLFVGNTDYQYRIIDTLAGNLELWADYKTALADYKALQKKRDVLKKRQQEAQKTYDYHLFLLNELKEINIEPGKQQEWEEQYNQLANVETLKETLSATQERLQQEDAGILDQLRELKKELATLKDYGQAYKDLAERMESVVLETEDITMEVEPLNTSVEDDPERLQQLNGKLQHLYRLQQKHSVDSEEELLRIQEDLTRKVATTDHAEKDTAKLEKALAAQKKEARLRAKALTKNRQKIIPEFTQSVEKMLRQLGISNAQLQIKLDQGEDFHKHGTDQMNWYFSANKGKKPELLKKTASGGELSRITLSIKSILASYSALPTIIFDEIDTGVSGEVAHKMGEIMAEMGHKMQVISITHLPQIAANGTDHFKVFKETTGGRTHTALKKLDKQERIAELSEMLGGKEKSASAVAHAESLLGLS